MICIPPKEQNRRKDLEIVIPILEKARIKCRRLLPDSIVPERIRSAIRKAAAGKTAPPPTKDESNQVRLNNHHHPDKGSHYYRLDMSALMSRLSRLLVKDKKPPNIIAPIKAPGFKFAPI